MLDLRVNIAFMRKNLPVIIIGAGISGLAAARCLVAANIPVLVLDKGRGVGGRMATRRSGDATFDHGAQFFSARTSDFQRVVEEAKYSGIVQPWWPKIPDNTHSRWIGTTGMNAVPKFLAESLTVLKEKRVTQIQAQSDEWHVITEELDVYQASAVLVTIPAPQALELLDKSAGHLPEFSHAPLHQIAYHPCFALLAILDRASNVPAPGGLALEHKNVTWIADNYQKGISKQPSVTVHASPIFSQLHLHTDPDLVEEKLLEAVVDYIEPAKVVQRQIHFWRYSLAYERYAEPFWQAKTELPLLFGGDGFGTGNVEGAFLSGLTMAEQLIEKLGR